MHDSEELRADLTDGWRRMLSQVATTDVPQTAVFETMAQVAIARLVEHHGSAWTRNYLDEIAELLRDASKPNCAITEWDRPLM